jgi:hypothetical protein
VTGAVLAPAWRRARFWVLLAALLVLAGIAVTAVRGSSGRPLDPSSPDHGGSKAIASVLRDYGVRVRTVTSMQDARGRVLVTDPDAYSAAQLRTLRERAGLVLLAPAQRTLTALGLPVRAAGTTSGRTAANCPWPGAAAGVVDLPPGTASYRGDGGQRCYGGAVVLGPGYAVLGSADLVRNDTVAREGVAALVINVLTDDRRVREVSWLLPGSDATAAAAPTYWALFPDGARRAFVALAVVGLLLVLWRGRRLGRVVREPLPVVVRAAEIVEGHGRLYLRAGARDRAAAALRAGFAARASAALGLPPGADLPAAVAARTGRDPARVAALLRPSAPADDTALRELALALDELEVELTAKGPVP